MSSGTADALSTFVADGVVELQALRKRVRDERSPGGRRVTDEEYDEIDQVLEGFLPGTGALSQTAEVCRQALSGASGIYGDKFIRAVTPLKRGMGIIALYPEDPEPEPYDQRAA